MVNLRCLGGRIRRLLAERYRNILHHIVAVTAYAATTVITATTAAFAIVRA